MSIRDVPLPRGRRAEIEASVADIVDVDMSTAIFRALMDRAQKEANRRARGRNDFRVAIQAARDRGDRNPYQAARFDVERFWIIERYEARTKASMDRVGARHSARVDRLETSHEKASSSANPSQRRFAQKDRQYVRIIGEAERGGTLGAAASVVQEIEHKIGHYRLPHWEKTTLSLKAMALSLETAKDGGQTINLRLSPTVCKEAMVSPRGMAAYLQDRIRRSLNEVFGNASPIDFWFVVEADAKDRFHLHGAVATPSSPSNAVKLVDAALRTAGGRWVGGGQQHQQVSASLDHPIYWAAYCSGGMNASRRHLGSNRLLGSTKGIKSCAVANWEGVRAALPQSSKASHPRLRRKTSRPAPASGPVVDVEVDVDLLFQSDGGDVDTDILAQLIAECDIGGDDALDEIDSLLQ